MPRRLADRLTISEYAVLGLLSLGAASGYELRRRAATGLGHLWQPNRSGIYAVLPRLAEAGHVTGRNVEQERRPDKQVFTLTEPGRAILRGWVEEVDADPLARPDTVMLKVAFGAAAPPAAVIAQIAGYRAALVARLAHYRRTEARVVADEAPEDLLPGLVLRHAIARIEITIRWADGALATLERAGEGR